MPHRCLKMKKNTRLSIILLCLLSAVLLSLPWLAKGLGFFALVGFVPLLIADQIADRNGIKKFWLYSFATFLVWNAVTTFWVALATLGGAIFAIVANALQMCLVWSLFRLAKRYLPSISAYVFLAALWMAFERQYFAAEISWPWLTLGHAFAQSTSLIQWYEYTGALGGSLWIWLSNLGLFAAINVFSQKLWVNWTMVARWSFVLAIVLVLSVPPICSCSILNRYECQSEGSVEVIIAQPNFDPYEKFQSLRQSEQTAVLLSLYDAEFQKDSASNVLLLAPETFTSDIVLNDIDASPTVHSIRKFLNAHPGSELLLGASTYKYYDQRSAPSLLARQIGDRYVTSHNSAMIIGPEGEPELYHKSKLVVGTELTPFPRIFVPLDDWLSEKLGYAGLMGRCEGQDEVSLLHYDNVPIGAAVCYESVFGEHCAEYVKKGAQALVVITNDAWWGDTPGYRQHLSYSCLRAIELRRDIARCGNTGISCFINQKGEIVSATDWWVRTSLRGNINLNQQTTFFAENGDLVGRISTLVALLFAALCLMMALKSGRS